MSIAREGTISLPLARDGTFAALALAGCVAGLQSGVIYMYICKAKRRPCSCRAKFLPRVSRATRAQTQPGRPERPAPVTTVVRSAYLLTCFILLHFASHLSKFDD